MTYCSRSGFFFFALALTGAAGCGSSSEPPDGSTGLDASMDGATGMVDSGSPICGAGSITCGATCVDPTTDAMHCGGCDIANAPDEATSNNAAALICAVERKRTRFGIGNLLVVIVSGLISRCQRRIFSAALPGLSSSISQNSLFLLRFFAPLMLFFDDRRSSWAQVRHRLSASILV